MPDPHRGLCQRHSEAAVVAVPVTDMVHVQKPHATCGAQTVACRPGVGERPRQLIGRHNIGWQFQG